MKVAIYQCYRFHTEIFGGFLELLKSHDVTIFNDSGDQTSWIGYYMRMFKISKKVISCNKLLDMAEEFDRIIIATANDYIDGRIYEKYMNKIIFVNHLQEHIGRRKIFNVVLSPLCMKGLTLQQNQKLEYILPIYDQIEKSDKKENIFAIVGHFVPSRDIEDLEIMLKNSDRSKYKIRIMTRDGFITNRLNKFNNVSIHVNLNGSTLIEKIKDCKFLLPLAKKNGWYHNDRLSGSIPLGINNNIPLVLDEELHNIYGLEGCLTYKKSLTETIDTMINMKDEEYTNLLNKFILYKKNMINRNNNNFKNLLEVPVVKIETSNISPIIPIAHIKNIIESERMDVWLCSYGGCGTNMLANFLDPFFKIKTQSWGKGLCHFKEPIDVDKKIKGIFIYRNPYEAIISQFNRSNNGHTAWINIQKINNNSNIYKSPINTNLEDFINNQEDLFKMEEQFDNWRNKNVSYPILLIKYEKVFEHLDVIFDFLGLDKKHLSEFPKKRENKSSTIQLRHNLKIKFENIYKNLVKKINKMPDYLIR